MLEYNLSNRLQINKSIGIKAWLFSFIMIMFGSCIKEKTTHYKAYLKNPTNHRIVIKGYKGGVPVPNEVIELGGSEEIKYADGWLRGEEMPMFFADYFKNVDSVVVTFDNQYNVTHYTINPALQSPKSYSPTNPRNILNYKNFVVSYVTDGLTYKIFTYTFTEADYQFAL